MCFWRKSGAWIRASETGRDFAQKPPKKDREKRARGSRLGQRVIGEVSSRFAGTERCFGAQSARNWWLLEVLRVDNVTDCGGVGMDK